MFQKFTLLAFATPHNATPLALFFVSFPASSYRLPSETPRFPLQSSVCSVASKKVENMSDGGGSSSPDRQERVQIALDEVSLFEHTGRILNDHYTKKEYIQRRLGFLDKHPNYRCLPKLLPKVNQEADEVFCDQEEEISVQQVRQRELDCEVDPLLPLPTTANTETLDDFQSYGDTERRPGQQPSQPAVSKPTVKRPGAFSALPPTNLAETRQTRSMVKKAVGSLRQAPSSTLSEGKTGGAEEELSRMRSLSIV